MIGEILYHEPVFKSKVLEFFQAAPEKVFLDCTVGTGGHAEALLENGAKVYGLDLDAKALDVARKRLERFGERLVLYEGNFKEIDSLIHEKVDGILFDLGLSSLQLDNGERGFSFQIDSPLDMRMSLRSHLRAEDIINNATEEELFSILRDFGNERYAKRIARRIVKDRQRERIKTTRQLVGVLSKALPSDYKRRLKINYCTKTFQAIRIAVNDELENLKRGLEKAVWFLKKDGILIVIAFHSLEDRIVKRQMRNWERDGIMEIITKKPIVPSRSELMLNPRSRSARLRAARRLF